MSDTFPLHQMIQSLRAQLEKCMADAKAEELQLKIGSIDLELKVVAASQDDLDGGIGWSVLRFGAKTSKKDETVHTLRINLRPEGPAGGDVRVSAAVED